MSLQQRVSQVCSSVLQCVAVYCRVLPMVAGDAMCLEQRVDKVCSVLQCVLQCVAMCCLWRQAMSYPSNSACLRCVAVCRSVLQCIAVYCIVLQCVAV